MKFKIKGLCLAFMALASVFALGTGSASAVGLLFKPESGVFPYHATGLLVAKGTLASSTDKLITSTAVHVLVLALTPTLFDAHFLFLGATSTTSGVEECKSSGLGKGEILLSLEGHLGLAHDPNGPTRHAVLLLIPSGFSFECIALGGLVKEKVEVSGNVVGSINKPAAGAASEELGISFTPSPTLGKQLFTTFLFTGGGSTRVLLLSKLGSGSAEESAQEEPQAIVKALPGLGAFLLILD